MLLAIAAPSTAWSATRTVCASGCTHTSIAGALAVAVDGDVIEVRDSATYVGTFDISQDLTIQVQSPATPKIVGTVIVQGSSTLAIAGIGLTGGTAHCLDVRSGATVTLTGLTIEGCSTTTSGGGIYASVTGTATTITGTNVTFRNNSTGTGVGKNGAHVSVTGNVRLTFTGSTFGAVTAIGDLGGAIFMDGTNAATLRVYSSTFTGTTAPGGGGAIHSNADTIVRDSYFMATNTTGTGNGGAIYLTGSAPFDIVRSSFCTSTAGGNGGAIYATVSGNPATRRITNSIFVGNSVTSANKGGAVYITGSGAAASVVWNDFLANSAPGSSGQGSALWSDQPSLAVHDSLIAYNTGGGPAVFLSGSGASVGYGLMFSNTASDISETWRYVGMVPNTDPILNGWDSKSPTCGPTQSSLMWQEYLSAKSPMIDAAYSLAADPDGSRADIGAFGGPNADPAVWADTDKDGLPVIADCDDKDATSKGFTTVYADTDGDGFGTGTATTGCAGSGFVANATDCNDKDKAVNPSATEACNTKDDDCDKLVDEAGATGATTYYQDSDADTYGNSAKSVAECAQPSGYVTNATDCDDTNKLARPNQAEKCATAFDDNCDGKVNDSSATDVGLWYADVDKDSYGNTSSTVSQCTNPGGYVLGPPGDCNDNDKSVYPTAIETCNKVDDDCDSKTDEGLDQTWYADVDKDSYGNTSSTLAQCSNPGGYVLGPPGDCNDNDKTIYPTATETCNKLDDNCDTKTDEGLNKTWYADVDKDSYGNTSSTLAQCWAPANYVLGPPGDCNDNVAAIHPTATEVCGDGIDSDCNLIGGPPADDDKDGLLWETEVAAGSSDCNVDTDADTVVDKDEYGTGKSARDSDGDGKVDMLDTDDDNDLTSTKDEVAILRASPASDDNDGIPAWLDADDDNDGIPSAQEAYRTTDFDGDALLGPYDPDDDDDGVPTSEEGAKRDTDLDGVVDYIDSDDDDDGIPTKLEVAAETDWLNPDGDNDTLLDGEEWGKGALPRDSDGDGLVDPADDDDDDDGIPTADEGSGDVDCPNPDNIPNHLDLDSDGDGKTDESEGTGDQDKDFVPNYADCADTDGGKGDSDNDGLSNIDEIKLGLDPTRVDTDEDGVIDGDEVQDVADPDDTDEDGVIDALDEDDDGDGIDTAIELGDDPDDPQDTDADDIPDYIDLDDDGDGAPTADEGSADDDEDGIVNYLDDDDQDGPAGDEDGDGLSNVLEDELGTDRSSVDSDRDGIPDGIEIGALDAPTDSDGDGIFDVIDDDDDGDGIPTNSEGSADPDKDGIPNFLDDDSDGDDIADDDETDEDPDCDGIASILDPNEADGPCVQADRDDPGIGEEPVPLPSCGCITSSPNSAIAGALLLTLITRRRRR